MSQIFWTDYAPAKVAAQEGDLMVVRNVENRLRVNHLYQLDKDGLWSQIPVPAGVSIVDFAKHLSGV